MDNKSLAIALATCEKEDDVIRLLKAEGLWDDPTRWRNFGDNKITGPQLEISKAMLMLPWLKKL